MAADAGIAPLPEYEGASKGTAKKSALGKPRPAKTAPAVEFDSATSPPPAMPPPAAPPPRAQETRVTPPPPGPATESSDVEFGGDGKDAAAPGWRQSTTTTVTGPGPAK
ncbi:MAG: hypothetical protein HY075_09885 [Deltaproteobacteria bacterium]|nr:hypothetical protein [Deltaproteobacteria bacterium]